MTRYLWQVSFTPAGLQGVLAEGGSSRVVATTRMVEGLGGRLEACYFAFGEYDVYLIVDLPSHVDAAAISLAVNASGATVMRTVVLMTPAEIDAAAARGVAYRPPGA